MRATPTIAHDDGDDDVDHDAYDKKKNMIHYYILLSPFCGILVINPKP